MSKIDFLFVLLLFGAEMSKHICDTRKCGGKNYDGFYLRCSECNECSMMDCIFEYEQAQVILRLTGLYHKKNNLFTRNKDNEKVIKDLFAKGSPFAFVCANCKIELAGLKGKLMESGEKLKQTQHQLETARKNAKQMDEADLIESIKTQDDINSNTNPFDVFVSNFRPNTECDAITALIIGNTSLAAENFEVIKMAGPKTKIKYRKFISFKIRAFDKPTFDRILCDDIWMPFTKAVPFDANATSASQKRKQQKKQQKQSQQIQQNESGQQVTTSKQNTKRAEPVIKPVNTQKKPQIVNQQNDNPRTRTHPQKSSQPHAGTNQKTAKPPNGSSNGTNHSSRWGDNHRSDRNGSHHHSRGSNFQNRPGPGSNFHGKRRYNHRPLDQDLKSVLSLLMRVLDKY